MMKICTGLFMIVGLLFAPMVLASSSAKANLHKIHVDLHDKASLQRGAQLYVNYCAGCHTLKFMRYARLAKDIGIVDGQGNVDQALLMDNLIFTDGKIFDTMRNAMPLKDGKQWFGVAPPDLSLIARVRGVDWLYTYLLQFYSDPKRPWGVNNVLFPDVAMPNVLLGLQGEQVPHYTTHEVMEGDKRVERQVLDHLELKEPGSIDSAQFDETVKDLVNFLAYVAEPVQLQRKRIGWWVLGFLFIFTILAYCLKKEYWKDIK